MNAAMKITLAAPPPRCKPIDTTDATAKQPLATSRKLGFHEYLLRGHRFILLGHRSVLYRHISTLRSNGYILRYHVSILHCHLSINAMHGFIHRCHLSILRCHLSYLLFYQPTIIASDSGWYIQEKYVYGRSG